MGFQEWGSAEIGGAKKETKTWDVIWSVNGELEHWRGGNRETFIKNSV